VLNITGPNDGAHCVTFSREKSPTGPARIP
jgi:hypothetical protein